MRLLIRNFSRKTAAWRAGPRRSRFNRGASASWSQTAPYGTPEGLSGAPAGRAIPATWGYSRREGRGGRKGGPGRATGRVLWPTCGRPPARPLSRLRRGPCQRWFNSGRGSGWREITEIGRLGGAWGADGRFRSRKGQVTVCRNFSPRVVGAVEFPISVISRQASADGPRRTASGGVRVSGGSTES